MLFLLGVGLFCCFLVCVFVFVLVGCERGAHLHGLGSSTQKKTGLEVHAGTHIGVTGRSLEGERGIKGFFFWAMVTTDHRRGAS